MNAPIVNRVLGGDCRSAQLHLPQDSVDLILTSPPYAMRRKDTYGGVPTGEYVGWMLECAAGFERLLKPTGSFVLNIKEHCEDGERSDYVMRLVLALREQGWRLVDQFIWTKPNPVPGAWRGRLKDGWEHLFHFTRSREFKFFPDELRKPLAERSLKAYAAGGYAGGEGLAATGSGFNNAGNRIAKKIKELSATGSGFTKNREAEKTWMTALPSNVISAAVGCGIKQKDHSAVMPAAIPEFFIKLMTEPGDVVLDPFAGSGTTLLAAKRLGRGWIGIEINEDYCRQIKRRMEEMLV